MSENFTILTHIVKNAEAVSFSWYDYILFSLMLTLSAAIGIYFGCFGTKQSTANEYLMGDKKMKVFPISISLVASHISGLTLLAVPADIYRFGSAYWMLCPICLITAVTTIYVYLPVFYKLQLTSTYEYLEKRFDNKNRMLASFLFALGLFLYLPIVIYIPALAFSAATGINVHYVTPLVCGVCIFYTTLGGLKAVVWTDTLQFVVTLGAVFTVCTIGVQNVGGIAAVWTKALEGHRLDVFDFDPDPTKRDSFWICSIGTYIAMLSMCGIHQSCVQKFLSVDTFRESKLAVIYFGIGISTVTSIAIFIGLIMYSKYADCDPFTTGAIQRNDQLLPYYIMDVASSIPGLSGLFIAGIFCAALSTLSASLNCLAGTTYEDFIAKRIGTATTELQISYILKTIVLVIGVICTLLIYIIEKLGGLLPLAISLSGVTSGPLLGMFTLGILFPKASSKGSFYGTLAGMLFASWIVVMAQYYKSQGLIDYPPKPTTIEGCFNNFTEVLSSTEAYYFTENITISYTTPWSQVHKAEPFKPFFLFRISYYYYTTIGCLVTMIVGLLISYILTNDDPPVHRDLLSPVIYFLLPDEELETGKIQDYYSLDKALQLITLNNKEESIQK